METKLVEKSFWAIDVACAVGLEVDIKGKLWNFSPLSLMDLARVARRQRAEAVAAYEEGQRIYMETHGQPASDGRQRLNDLNGLCFGAVHAQMGIDIESYNVKRLKAFLSVRKNHPDIFTEEQCDVFFEDQEAAAALSYKIDLMTAGPVKNRDGPGSDPTSVQPDTTSASATSSDTLVGQ